MTLAHLPPLATLSAPLRPQAVLSMLHEPAHSNCATRLFRDQPVLAWTLHRLTTSQLLAGVTVICWDDQLDDVNPLAEEHDANLLVKNGRQIFPAMAAISAARRWHDGWRGGPKQSCWFDRGFYAPWLKEVADETDADAIVLIDPASALVDAPTIDRMIEQAREQASHDLFFTPGVPGLGGALLRTEMLAELGDDHPGRQLCYLPEQPQRDPIGTPACVDVPVVISRTPGSLLLDSERQVQRVDQLSADLNGQLARTDGEQIAARLAGFSAVESLPREITLELTTRRRTQPIYLPRADRPDLAVWQAGRLFQQLSRCDDVRLTLAGSGDPLMHPAFVEVIEQARYAGIKAICVETDLLPQTPEFIGHLANSGVDVVAVHLPALTPETYAAVMGQNALGELLENLSRLVQVRKGGTPLIIPIFTKTTANMAEMERWYDYWLSTLDGVAVRSPAAGCDEVSVADMSPSMRRPCWRINRRMTVLSDGRYVTCEQDVHGVQALGSIEQISLEDAWRKAMGEVRASHAANSLASLPVCKECKQWHQP